MKKPIVEIEQDMPIEYLRCILAYLKSDYPRGFIIKKVSINSDKKRIDSSKQKGMDEK